MVRMWMVSQRPPYSVRRVSVSASPQPLPPPLQPLLPLLKRSLSIPCAQRPGTATLVAMAMAMAMAELSPTESGIR